MNKASGHSFCAMQCNRCNTIDKNYTPDLSGFDLQENGEGAIEFVKKHFSELGWQVSWGYDLCPKCVAELKTENE